MRLDALVDDLRSHGLRMTPQRRHILQLLLDHGDHLTAHEVHQKMRPVFPDVSLDTVYRTLRTLAVLGIACQTHLQTPQTSKFALVHGHHHHHLICIDCGESVELSECPVAPLAEDIKKQYGFHAAGHALEIYGYCAPCEAGRKAVSRR